MPAADLAAILASLPPLTFAPAAEAPVAPLRWCLVAPGGDSDWAIARRLEEGWADTGEELLREPPLLYAPLPAAPFRPQYVLKGIADKLAEHIGDGRFDEAARLIDELADQVRAIRDSPVRRLAD